MSDLFDKELDSADIIPISIKQDQTQGRENNKRPPGANTAHRVELIKQMRAAAKGAAADTLSPEEIVFAEMIAAGEGMAQAYESAYPDKCYSLEPILNKDGEHLEYNGEPQYKRVELLTYHQKFDRGNKLSRMPGVRSKVILLLDQEDEDTSHTARRLDNFIVKALEKEAINQTNSASARISALDKLSKHRAVVAAEAQREALAKRDLAPEQVMDEIRRKLEQYRQTTG